MDSLIIDNVRCFKGRHEAPLKPLTLLVGENSTGKTTFLASVKAALALQSAQLPDFNEKPFLLGSFDQIANDGGGWRDRAVSFTIGNTFLGISTETRVRAQMEDDESDVRTEPFHVEGTFVSIDGQPSIDELIISNNSYEARLSGLARDSGHIVALADERVIFSDSLDSLLDEHFIYSERDLYFLLHFILPRKFASDDISLSDAHKLHLAALTETIGPVPSLRPYSFAPIRTQPKRTYEPAKEIRMPEGNHVPLTLKRLYSEKSRHRTSLEEFGKQSGLYDGLNIHKWGEEGSDPFQIQIKLHGGLFRNLVDVGYGVSQVLPIIADSVLVSHRELGNGRRAFSANRPSMLLVQQPEVHLHPRAQAELGSFFVGLLSDRKQGFVIETHSDYLIDRVRLDIRDNKIGSEDVILLYFEQASDGANIYPIELDDMGNVLNAPPSYRDFFLEEERRYLNL